MNDLAAAHHQLGNIYYEVGDLEQALYHFSEAIRYMEMAGNIYEAGKTRRNVAIALQPPLLEDTVKMAVLGPLLYFAGFYLYPFHTKSEYSVKISNRDGEIIVEGKIDVLVLKEQFWIMVIESKQVVFSIEAGLAQILAYMLANKHQEKPCFGMITTGGSFVFIKLVKSEMPQYALSRVFELNNPGNDLYTVLSVLKQLEQATLNESSLSA